MTDEYIRREDAITAACKGFCRPGVGCPETPCKEQTKYLRDLPSADVVPVRHGRWIRGKYTDDDLRYNDYSYRCNRCGKIVDFEENYCPKCGAIMQEES